MVNLDFEKFRKIQNEHKAEYIGSDKNKQPGFNDPEYNNQDNTDKSPGATGRDI
ncbi:hypothetical protein [Neobacillus bataviensis]|uniref:hypothetical protein n=1 Tax=Neobacillus bataviensis TaxID=220685 RepID=UPI0012FAA615|nr:hypothetical protein [Neobacillus bataviensis]